MILFTLVLFALAGNPVQAAGPITCASLNTYSPKFKQDSKTKQWCLQPHAEWKCRYVSGMWGSYKITDCFGSHPDKRVVIRAVMNECARKGISCSESGMECSLYKNSPYCTDQNPYDEDYIREQEEAKRRALEELDRARREEERRKFEEWCRQYPTECGRL